jgi:CRP/FNR family transcriptional regulator, cyclic AMP receptor protein
MTELPPLVDAIQTLNVPDAFRPRFTAEQWKLFCVYLTRYQVGPGQLVIKQGEIERAMYLLESGSLSVFVDGPTPAGSRLAILRAGSVVGEPGLFGDVPRMANVETITHSVVWALSGPRLDELTVTKPALALEVLRAAGAVMAIRMRANLDRSPTAT